MILDALKSITESQVGKVEVSNTDERESLVSSILTGILKTKLKKEVA
jgi:hypothetical protein